MFDLLTSPQGHQFDHRTKILLVFCSACHPRQFNMPHDHVWKKKFGPPWAPPAPQSPTPGARPQQQNENSVQYVFYLLFVRTHAKFGIKNRNWHGNRNLIMFDLLTSPQGHQFDHRTKNLLVFCSACHPRQFNMPHDHVWKKKFGPPWAPPGGAPKSHPWGMTKVTEWKSRLICFVSFICTTHTKFGIKIFEIDMLTKI